METALELLRQSGIANLSIGNLVMFGVAGVLIYLAITKEYEPLLLIPIGFGAILANLPLANMGSYGEGIIALIYEGGIRTELLPPLIATALQKHDFGPPRVAIIVDDAGYGGVATEMLLRLDPGLTIAVLPHTPQESLS